MRFISIGSLIPCLPTMAAGQPLYGTCLIHVILYKSDGFLFIISPSVIVARLDSCKMSSRSKLTVYTGGSRNSLQGLAKKATAAWW
ncbi:hypothetical protein GGR55DRAFT_664388 [Xylaria sp. FL0064]|nr:hypothetical protein GGR55DRAFT_664388 [Xylaria sp. FL0064]